MDILIKDYNNANALIASKYASQWDEISRALSEMPLHLKASDQAGKQGQAIFDPVGTNAFIKSKMVSFGWTANKEIPKYNFLGSDVDFVKSGIIVEVQFSNYPFLLNNLLRSELFFKAGTKFTDHAVQLLIVITKSNMYPSSNSTLYFEQACNQLDALSQSNVFDVPIRLVGLSSPISATVPCKWTIYDDPRYSRTVISQKDTNAKITSGKRKNSKVTITLLQD